MYFRDVSGEDFSPSSGSPLIPSIIIKCNDMSNRLLSEEKEQKKLINANVITRHNAIVISCDEQMQISSFSLFKHFSIKVNDVTIKIIKIEELSSPKGE